MNSFADWVQLGVSVGVVFLLLFAVFLLMTLIAAVQNNGKAGKNILKIRKFNTDIAELKDKLFEEILTSKELKKHEKLEKNNIKAQKKQETDKERVFVLDFKGDIAASECDKLTNEITAVLQVIRPCDEVVVRLESAGGMVHAYGLAASQLARLKETKTPLVICVDKVAASGGYLMAVVATKIYAAPFAFIGSIGVISSLPNFHKVLEKNNIDYLEMTAGEYKRTVTMFGEITESHKAKHQENLELIHRLFKHHIEIHRPIVNIEKVSTGEYWPATEAMQLNLVDDIKTSEAYLLEKARDSDVYIVSLEEKKSLKNKLMKGAKSTLANLAVEIFAKKSLTAINANEHDNIHM